MSSTILSIIQQFCQRVNIPAPIAVVAATSPAERQYLSLLKYIGDNLRNRPFMWPQLKRGYVFTTSTGVSNYQLPGDFYRILDSTQWDVTNQWPLIGPISDFNSSLRKYAVVSLQTRKAYQIVGPTQYLYNVSPYAQRSQGWFQISPAATNSTDQLFLGYMSASWVWPKSWVTATSYPAGTIIAGNGYMYRTAAGGVSGATRPSHSTGTATDGTVSWTVFSEFYACDPSNTSLADTDLCLFDEDILIDGLVWAYRRSKRQEYQDLRVEWEDAVKAAYSRFDGPKRISMADQFSAGDDLFPFTAPGSWSV